MNKLLLTAASVALVGSASAQSVQNIVLFADGAGAVGSTGLVNNTRRVEFVDLDNDGDVDLFEANFDAPCVLYINDGSGSFSIDLDANTNNDLDDVSATVKGVSFGDWDGDGDQDCVLALAPDGAVQQANLFLRNDSTVSGDPVFTLISPAGPAGHADHSYDVAFVDGNGGAVEGDDLLLIVANRRLNGVPRSGANRVYVSDGLGGFTEDASSPITTDGSFNSRALLVGDLDGDGLDDVLVLNASSVAEANQAYRSTGAGGFVADAVAGFVANPGNSYGGALGDLDGDGDLDLVVANRASATVGESNSVFRNDSTPGDIVMTLVSGSAIDAATATSYDVGIADLDGDGDNDIVVANNLQANAVYMNNAADLGLAAADVLGASFGAAFTKVTHGAIQSDTGRTRSVTIAEVADYGPNSNHQGPEVALANASSGGGELNFYFRNYGKMFADLGGANTGFTTAKLTGAGFLAPSSDASLQLTAQKNSVYQLLGSLSVGAAPFAGGTVWVTSFTPLVVGNTGPSGSVTVDIPAGSLPSTSEGVFIVFQVATQDSFLSPDPALSNGLSAMIQGDS